MSKKFLFLPIPLILVVSLLSSKDGYHMAPANPGLGGVIKEDSKPITGPGHDQWEILQKAIALLQSAATFCEEESGAGVLGGNPHQGVIDKISEMAGDNRIDIFVRGEEATAGKDNEHTIATTRTMSSTHASSQGRKNIPVYHGQFSHVGPGINFLPAMFPASGCEPSDVATLASILFHEGVHAKEAHGNDTPVTDAEEKEAYEKEAAMLCCMVDSIEATQPEGASEMIGALNVRYWTIALLYYCKFGGTPGDLVECESFSPVAPWVFALWGFGSLQQAPPPSSILPRDPISPEEMNVSRIYHRTPIGLFALDLFPQTKKAMISLMGSSSGAWEVDLGNQPEGTFQPLCMVQGNPGNAIVCGRLEGVPGCAIYRLTATWSGSEPNPQMELLFQSGAIGDISSVTNIEELNGKIAVFDFTHAAIHYIDLSTDDVTTLVQAEPGYPALLASRGMNSHYMKAMPGQGLPAGVLHTLLPTQTIDLLSEETFVHVIDRSMDGTMDDFIVE